MKSSIQDVAQLAHVSISTVSRSFTRPDLVSKATRDKVMKAADELNFSISRSAAALKTGRALRIAVLVSGRLNLWFSSSIIEGLNQIFHDEGYDISIYQMSSIEERREFFDMLPVRRNVDAVIRHFLRYRRQRDRSAQVRQCANHRHQLESAGRARFQRGRAHRRQAGIRACRTPSYDARPP